MGARCKTTDSYTEFGRKLRERMRQLKNKPHVETGFPVKGEEASFTDTPYDNDALTVGEVAVFNEFGTENIPERPFVRGAFDKYRKDMGDFIGKVLAEIVTGRITMEQGLARIGIRHVSQIQTVIDSDVPPPNAMSTILNKLRKGGHGFGDITPSAGPGTLRDTGQMRASVTYETFPNGAKGSE